MIDIIVEKDGERITIPISQYQFQNFEKRHGEGSSQEVFQLLADRRNSITDVARHFGFTRQRLHQIYQKNLEPYFGESGHERSALRTALKVHGTFADHVLRVWRVARRQGIRVEHVNYPVNEGRVWRTDHGTLQLNGKFCSIYLTRNIRAELWAGVNVRVAMVQEFDFHIFVIQVPNIPEKFFILPAEILATLPRMKTVTSDIPLRKIYIPLGKWYEYSQDWKIPWDTYENAWHLLKKEPQTEGTP